MPGAINAGEAFVSVIPDAKAFAAKLKGAILPDLKKASADVSAEANSAAAATSKASGLMAAAFAVVGIAAIKFAADSIEAYREHQVVITQLQTTIARMPQLAGATTAAFEEQATALQNLTGVEDEEILAAQDRLAIFGLTQDQILATIPTILDMAQVLGMDATSAANAFGKALNGNSRLLKQLGINFTATGDRAKDLARLTDLLRSKVAGAAEAFGQTATGKMAIFQAKLNDLQEVVGEKLVPAISDLVDGLSALLPVLTPIAAAVADVVRQFGDMAAGVGHLNTNIPQVIKWLSIFKGGIPGIQDGLEGVTQAQEDVNQVLDQSKVKYDESGFAIDEMGNRVDALGKKLKEFPLVTQTTASSVADALNMTLDEFRTWRAGVAESINFVTAKLGELSGKAHVTAADILKAFTKALNAQINYGKNVQTLVDRNFPADLLAQLENLGTGGAGLMAALAHASDAQLAKIIAKMRATQAEAIRTAGAIGRIKAAAEAAAGEYGITFRIHTIGDLPPINRTAQGGVFRRFAEGTGFMGPYGPFIAGEASYPTPLGTGAEVVSNAGIMPLNQAMIDRLGNAVAKAGGHSDPDAIGRATARHMWQMMRAGGGREVTLRAKGRDLVGVITSEELWTR